MIYYYIFFFNETTHVKHLLSQALHARIPLHPALLPPVVQFPKAQHPAVGDETPGIPTPFSAPMLVPALVFPAFSPKFPRAIEIKVGAG